MKKISASQPTSSEGREYHIHVRKGDLSPLCLLPGDPDRAVMIADKFFDESEEVGNHRGMRAFTGMYCGKRISVVTTQMGVPSLGIVLPEAYRCGGKIFIRVGSCSALIKEAQPGDAIIINAACRIEKGSENWAPSYYPAFANHHVVSVMEKVAQGMAPGKYHIGVEATTDCFVEGQARENIDGYIPPELQAQHERLIKLGVACYSMEASGLFVWCATHGGGLPAGAINAVYGNRIDDSFQVAGEELTAEIALKALVTLTAYFPNLCE